MKRGKFITIEGPEGAGKSTQTGKLAEFLRASGIPVITTREPGGTPLAEELRAIVKGFSGRETVYPSTELLLMEAARVQHVEEVILPALERGTWVICDRFTDSTVAYQGAARGIGEKKTAALNEFAAGGCRPDLTLLIDLPPETGFQRTGKRSETRGEHDRFEEAGNDFHHTVRNAFLAIAGKEPDRVKVIDGTGSVEIVAARIREIVSELI